MREILTGRGVLLTLALAALATGLVRWLVASEDETLAQIRTTSVIRIGYAVEAPYAMIGTGGRVTGESPEVARLVAARMGIEKIEWVQTSFDALIVELQEGRFDLIAAGMFITPERALIVRFAEPTLRVTPGLLIRSGASTPLRSHRDAVASGKLRIAALAGSVEERELRALGLPASMLLSVPDAFAGRSAVESGAADALALSLPTIRRMALDRPATLQAVALPGQKPADRLGSTFYVGFAFSRENRALARAWNEAQAAIVGTPEHLRAIGPFGFDAADLPGSMTLAQLLER